jgi:hypothetical protein
MKESSRMSYITDCSIFILKVIEDWLKVIRQDILAKDLILNTVLFIDEEVVVASTEGELPRAACTLNSIIIKSD